MTTLSCGHPDVYWNVRKDAEGRSSCRRCQKESYTMFPCGHTNDESNISRTGNGYPRCKECHKVKQNRRRAANPETHRARVKESLHKQRDKIVDPIFEEQKGLCAICERPLNRYHLDHNHECHPAKTTCHKCRRGLLCADCNVKLAGLEKPGWKEKAEQYLEKWRLR